MTVTPTVAHAHEELREDHRRLHALVDRLRAASDPDVLVAVLEELHGALTAHFNAEEKPGGLYDALGVCVPEFRAELSGLVDDHFRLAAALRDMRDRARQGLGRAHDSLLGEAARLAQVLGEHEKREHAMVDAAMSRGA
jgi:malate synthase